MSLTDTITTVQGQVLEGLTTVQAPVVDAVTKAVEAVDGKLPEVSFVEKGQPAELVDAAFAFAQKVLDNQHEFVLAIVKALSPILADAPKAAAKPKVAKAA